MRTGGSSGVVSPRLRRLLEFAEPAADDICLDIACGDGPVPDALAPRVRHVTAVDATPAAEATDPAASGRDARYNRDSRGTRETRETPRAAFEAARRPGGRTPTVLFQAGAPATAAAPGRLPAAGPDRRPPVDPPPADPPPGARPHEGPLGRSATVRADATALPYSDASFTLITSRFSLLHLPRPEAALREMLRVCDLAGRVVIADLVRPNLVGPERDRLQRLRDPRHPGTLSIARLTELITDAGADIRRMDVFTVERPLDGWLAGVPGPTADRIRRALTDEVDGGPRTGARPRVISGELWFTQTWAHVAAQPLPRRPHNPDATLPPHP